MPIKTTLTTKDVEEMLKHAGCLRNRIIVMFYYDTAVRCSELLKIRVQDIDLDRETVLIPHLKRGIKKKCPYCDRKGGRATLFCSKCGSDLSDVEPEGIEERNRIIDISPELVELIRKFIVDAGLNTDSRLINTTRQNVYHLIRKMATDAGLGGKILINPETGKKHYVHPHSFRDSLALDWLEYAGDDMSKQKALQSHLGHKMFETTQKYNKLSTSAVAKVRNEVRDRRKLTDNA